LTGSKKHLHSYALKGKLFPVVTLALIVWANTVKAQLVSDLGDESKLYAESKQVNQFFRRFNGEEDEKGN